MVHSIQSAFGSFVEWFQFAPWGFICFILAVLGVLMAGPPLVQMIWGRPDIEMKFTKAKPGPQNVEAVGFYMNNKPISKAWLNWLGVVRTTAEDVVCCYRIWDAASGKEVLGPYFPRMWSDASAGSAGSGGAKRIALPASRFEVFVPLGAVKDKKFYVTKTATDHVLLPPGKYRVKATAEWAGKAYTKTKYFIVREADPYGFWDTSDE